MPSFTLHKVDEQLYQLLQKKSKEQNVSINKFVKGVLRSAFGLGNNNLPKRDLSDLYDMYSDQEWDQIEEHSSFFDTASLSPIDNETNS